VFSSVKVAPFFTLCQVYDNKHSDKSSDFRPARGGKKMPARRIQVSRNIPRDRISAYECELDVFGKPVRRGRYVTGWYEVFTVERLRNELMPKLAEYAAQGWSYPFLITCHELEGKSMATIALKPSKLRATASQIKFSRRRRKSAQTCLAVVTSVTEFSLLDG